MVYKTPPADRNLMREINQNTLLNLIRMYAPISRTRLATLSGLSVGTVVGITAELLKREIVLEQSVAETSSGRKPGLLELHPEGGYAIGLSLVEGDEIAVVLLNLLGEIVACDSWNAPLRDQGETVIATMVGGVEALIAQSGVPREKIIGLGCGLPGHVNAQTGCSIDNWIHNWHDLAIGEPLAQALGMPVFVDNVMDCLASYEKLFGRGKEYRDFLVVTLGRGIGLGMVINGDIYRGAMGGGGEFGHIPGVIGGRRCECGNYGCLEAYVADHGLLATYQELCQSDPTIPTGLTLAELQVQAQEGNPHFQRIFTQAGAMLGRYLATLVNLFNPECLIITGVNVHANDFIFTSMHVAMHQHTFSQLEEHMALVIETVTDSHWAQGSGCLVLRHFFLPPM